jgi:hypothetical protein
VNIGVRIVLGDVLAKHGLELRGRAHGCLAVEVAGVLARAAVPPTAAALGMPSGKTGHHRLEGRETDYST